ncbi:Uncharacterized protein OBRU01_07927 [Operophtera brumata]|uniref:Transmembrane protein 186 n=1 Tax=Operophtera brumata TaxID=104452 RepID=A0A0L7LFS3_OPEBR|nr:Uncharacterized protein OBRU01_07927 [Operophtera brumata]
MNCIRLLRLAERQTTNIFRITSVKTISGHHIKFTESQDRWRVRDGLSKEWQLIYKAPMEDILKYVTTYLTFSTATVALGSLYYGIFKYDTANWNIPIILGDDVVIANNGTECLVYLGTFIAFHIAVKVVLSKYVVRLYQNGDEYLAIFRGNTHNSIRKHNFHLKEFKKLNPTFVVSWGDARYGLGKKHGILLENYFKTSEYLNRLLHGNKALHEKEY